MVLSSIDPSADSSLDLTRGARLRASPRDGRRPTRLHRSSSSSPETAFEAADEQQIAASAETPASAQGKSSQNQKEPGAVPCDRPKLVLDREAVADVDGLEQEIAVLRASIRQLASNGDMDVHVKVLAELRHQIEALCRALKTQQSLDGPDGGGRAAEMRRVLEELGDDLGVAR